MDIIFSFALLGLFHLTDAMNCTFGMIVPSGNLTWCSCYDGFFCSKLDVPLDYQHPDLGRASVPLVKYPAQSNSTYGPFQGMILLNPGGPGASGVNEALGYASTIQAVVGTNWDIVGFDPRGMYLSEPVINCSATAAAQNATLDSRSVPRMADVYYNLFIEFGKALGEACEITAGGLTDAGPHMSTATTARDMLSIVDAFAASAQGHAASKPSHLLNYYGISYGTFLGQTFASMFPDRVGNVVLDGVVSPEGYLTNWTYNSVNHLDGVIAAFFIYCHEAGPSDCAYYTGSSPRDMYERFNQSFVQLDAQKAEAENWSNATDIEAALLVLKVGLLTTADTPFSYFRLLPDVLLALEKAISAHNISAWTEQAMTIYGDPMLQGYENPQWTLGVLCSDQDNRWYNKSLQDLKPLLEAIDDQSIVGDIWIKSMLACTGWTIKATEIFSGPFGGDTATPILFVGNTYDPVTPFDNALSSAPNYNNALVLTIDGMGHTTMATQNMCGFAKIGAYFQTGALPGNDSFCPLETGPFGILLNGTLQQNIMQAGLSNLVH
ncbi:TAP-like protein-domain-containing protein [Diplogelasinospora grovesii]|uniref:TAP-like protein-domain-containing protein n=1 Tax=Diplogelasinospora grovesii TaxID=303347 RepID=A0AAN6NER7_9PEZI|nr:TAP-like protein-domain-containing protein [Diplogelasinospora grovesii]